MSDTASRLGTAPITPLLIEFSVPAIVAMIVGSLYNIIDRVFIGHAVGSLGIAAVTVAFPVMLLQVAIGVLVGLGSTTLVSIRLGERRRDEAEHIMGNAVVLVIFLAVVLTSLGLAFLGPILRLIGTTPETFNYAADFLRIILLGSPLLHAALGLNNFIRAEGRPAKAMATMLVSTLMNLVLAPLFLFVFHWGMKGAAWATVLAQFCSFVWVVVHFASGSSLLKVRRRNLIPDWAVIRAIFVNGTAPFLMQLAISLQMLVMNKSLVHYGGELALSAMGIVLSLSVVLTMPTFGMGQGAQPIIGYNFGARRLLRVRETAGKAFLAGFLLCTVAYLCTRLWPVSLIAIFNQRDPALIRLGSHALIACFMFAPLISVQIISENYFQAIGRARLAMFLGLTRQIVYFIPLLLLLPLHFGLNGVIYAFPAADALSFLTAGGCMWREFRRLNRQIDTAKLSECTA